MLYCKVGYIPLYHSLAIYTEVTFVNVHHAQMSTFVIEVCLLYIGFVLENTGNVEIGAAPLVQHYSVFSARPSLGYGTLH